MATSGAIRGGGTIFTPPPLSERDQWAADQNFERRKLQNEIAKTKLQQELDSLKNGGTGGGAGIGLGQPISENNSGGGNTSGIKGMPESMAELEAFSDRAADKNLERQKKAWEAAAGFRNTEDLREHSQAVEMQGRVSADEQKRLGMQLGSQEKITGMTERGQTTRATLQDKGETTRLGMQLGSQKELTGMTEAGQTNRLGMQLGSQEKLAKLSDTGETTRLGMQIGSQERMQKSGFEQDYRMAGYQQQLGEQTKQQDAARAARAFKQF